MPGDSCGEGLGSSSRRSGQCLGARPSPCAAQGATHGGCNRGVRRSQEPCTRGALRPGLALAPALGPCWLRALPPFLPLVTGDPQACRACLLPLRLSCLPLHAHGSIISAWRKVLAPVPGGGVLCHRSIILNGCLPLLIRHRLLLIRPLTLACTLVQAVLLQLVLLPPLLLLIQSYPLLEIILCCSCCYGTQRVQLPTPAADPWVCTRQVHVGMRRMGHKRAAAVAPKASKPRMAVRMSMSDCMRGRAGAAQGRGALPLNLAEPHGAIHARAGPPWGRA